MLNIYRPENAADARVLNKLQHLIRTKSSTLTDASNTIVGTESMSATDFDNIDKSHDAITTVLATELPGLGNESASAMAQALMVCSDAGKLSAAMTSRLGDVLGNESFDSDSVVKNIHLTVGISGELAMAKSDAGFLFPSVVVDQATTNYKLKANRTVIEPKFYHDADGSVTNWGKLNLLNASIKSGLLRAELNVFVPELKAGNEGAFVSTDYITPWTVTRSDGKKVTTSYLGATGEDLNLITLSTAKGMDRNTESTILDRIDEGAKIKGIIIGVGDAATPKAAYLSTVSANHSTFTKSETDSENNTRGVSFGKTTMMLSLTDYVTPEHGGFPAIADIPELKALLDAGYTRIGFKIPNTYSLELSEGTYGTTKATPSVVHLEKDDAPGVNVIEAAKSADAALINAIKAIFVGTNFYGTLSNATLKMDGDKLGSQSLEKLYTLNVRTPIEIRTNVLSKLDDNDAIKMISQALTLRRDDETVAEFDQWFEWAVANLGHRGVSDSARTDLDIIGLHYLAQPYVKRVEIDLADLLKEEDTTSKLSVLEVGLTTKMQDELVQMFQATNQRTVMRSHGSSADAVPLVGLFGDSRLTSYVMRTGEDRTFGDGNAMQKKPMIHATDRESMRGVIYAMPLATNVSDEKDRIFGFGHSIEITPIVVKRARDNGVASDQLQIWPVYTNIPTNPQLIRFEVTGLDEYFSNASADKTIAG